MANRPANAGSGRGLAPMGDAAPPLDAAAPPAVHHEAPRVSPPRADGFPRADTPPAPPAASASAASPAASASPAAAPRAAVGHRTARRLAAREREAPGAGLLAWVPYLIMLAGAAAGMFLAWQGPKFVGRGAGLAGCSLLAAALARLTLPPRYAGLLASRRKASDVLAFAVFGAAVVAAALMLP